MDVEIPVEAVRCIKLAESHDDGDFYNRLADFMALAGDLESENVALREALQKPVIACNQEVIADAIRWLDNKGLASSLMGWGEGEPKHTVRWYLEDYVRNLSK